MDIKDLQITHNPLGNEQPYFQQPFERFPRYPMAGQAVSVGAVIIPMDEGEYVDLLWRSTSEHEDFNSIPAICIGTSDSVGNSGCDRYWLAVIPPVAGGTEVEYCFQVSSGRAKAKTELFKYIVGTVTIYDRVLESGVDEDTLYIKSESSRTQESLLWEFTSLENEVVTTYSFDCDFPKGVTRNKLPDTGMKMTLPHSKSSLTLMPDGDFRLRDAQAGTTTSFSGRIERSSCLVGGNPFQEISFTVNATPEEKFFGFGERYNKLDQRGEIIQNRVFEQYKNQRLKTYMPIPFYQSNRRYGFSIDTNRNAVFDICSKDDRYVNIKAEIGSDMRLSCHWYFGSPKVIQRTYSQKQLSELEIPDWVLGPWMSSNEWNSQQRVLSEVKTGNDLDIPATVVVIEAWSDEATFYIWNDAEYEPKDSDQSMKLDDFTFPEDGLWPDPKGMVDQLHAEGKRLVLWQIPVVKEFENPEETPLQQKIDQEYVESAGLCLREADGSAYRVRPGWFSHSRVPDLAAKRVRDWWFDKRAYLMNECGVDGFKTDGGEHLWGYDVQASAAYEKEQKQSVLGDQMINTFPLSYISSYHEAMRTHIPDGDGITFSRSGYTGAGSYPCHWTGDQGSTWDAYRGVINAVLNANISGVPIIGWDIGGFSGEIPTAELYLRSTAAATFSPIMQYHSEYYDHVEPHVDRTPWNIARRCDDPSVIDIYRMYAKLRMEMIPYITVEIEHTKNSGEPLLRPLWLDSPDDLQCWEEETSYRFGRSLLIAPVMNEGEVSREIYLPPGRWEDVWTGKTFEGGQIIEKAVPLDTIPVFRDLESTWSLPPELFRESYKEL